MGAKQTQRLTYSQKNAKNKQWYKDMVDSLCTKRNTITSYNSEPSDFLKMKINYDLFNNKIDIKEFGYVCKPFGDEVGELPAQMVNRDIVSGKIKAVLGREMKMPFNWKALAVNPEATTRREQEHFNKIKEYANALIMKPIKSEIEQRKQQATKGKDLSEDEIQKISEQLDEELKAMTPPEVDKYMKREYQDPAEMMSSQLLEYFSEELDLKNKFNDAFKHGLLSAHSVMYQGGFNDKVVAWNVNSMRFDCEKSPDVKFIEDSEWATCEYRMSPSDVVKYFGDELSQKQIDEVYESVDMGKGTSDEDLFNLLDGTEYFDTSSSTLKVTHCVWKSLRRIGFLDYLDENNEVQSTLVDETYKLDTEAGDIEIEWRWIPESYEAWKIADFHVRMRPIPGQFKDENNLYHCKLPYYGVIYDNMNSEATALMDRLRYYQYYYDIIMYKIEILMASDKGKKVMLSPSIIPKASGIDMKTFQYFMESTPFMWVDPTSEGNNSQDIATSAKEIDLSLASDIGKYIEFAEYIKTQAGKSVGIPDDVEGQAAPNQAVTNVQQNIVNNSYILEPYFNLHNLFKRNFLQGLIETAKVVYAGAKAEKLSYVLDDMSIQTLTIDGDTLNNNTIGIYVNNTTKAQETKDLITQLSHAALQNQRIELSDVVSVIRQDSIIGAEESLRTAEDKLRNFEQQNEQQKMKAMAEEAEKDREFKREEHEMEIDSIITKEEERRKTEVIKASIMGASFNPDQDKNNNGVNDFLEISKHGLDSEIKREQINLDRQKLDHQKKVDSRKLDLEEKKIQKEAKNKTGNK